MERWLVRVQFWVSLEHLRREEESSCDEGCYDRVDLKIGQGLHSWEISGYWEELTSRVDERRYT